MSRFRPKAEPRPPIPETEAPVVTERSGPPYAIDDVLITGAPTSRIEVAHYTATNWGRRHDNEDRWVACRFPHTSGLDFHFVGVLDGHDTEEASDLVSRNLPGVLSRILKTGTGVVESSTRAMAELEEQLKELHSSAGTCVLNCCLAGRTVWCSNLGDCRAGVVHLQVLDPAAPKQPRAPLVQSLHWLSRDQKASTPEERRRIDQAGGFVCDGRVEGLEPSRTLGDFDVKCQVRRGVISIIPEVRRHILAETGTAAQALLVCATDGVWDVITGQDLCNLIVSRKELVSTQLQLLGEGTATAQPLADLAEDLVHFSIAKGSRDDCTAIVAMISVPPDCPSGANSTSILPPIDGGSTAKGGRGSGSRAGSNSRGSTANGDRRTSSSGATRRIPSRQ